MPGDLFVIGEDLIAEDATPDRLAGHLLAATLAPPAEGALQQALDYAGPRAAVQLLTSGHLPATALQGYGEVLLSQPLPRPEDAALLALMAEKGVSSEPYARALDPSGESVLGLIEADPYRMQSPPAPVLTDEQWKALHLICAG